MGQPMPPHYPGPMYPMSMEGMLTRRNVFALNGLALLVLWLAALFAIISNDLNVRGFARFLAISGGILGALGSTGAALGSKHTTDMQNLGLFIWSGLLLAFTSWILLWIG